MRIPRIVIPILVVAALFGGFVLRSAFTQPTTAMSNGAAGGVRLECIVDGVKCKGTAGLLASRFQSIAGINGLETFATEHRVVFTYNPEVITPEQIRALIEAPLVGEDGTTVEFFKVLSMQ